MFNIFICFTNQLDSCQHRYSGRPFLSETVRCRNDFTSESRKDDVNKIVVEYQGEGWRENGMKTIITRSKRTCQFPQIWHVSALAPAAVGDVLPCIANQITCIWIYIWDTAHLLHWTTLLLHFSRALTYFSKYSTDPAFWLAAVDPGSRPVVVRPQTYSSEAFTSPELMNFTLMNKCFFLYSQIGVKT